MSRRVFSLSLLSVLCCLTAPSIAAAPSDDPKNAAHYYVQAFKLMPADDHPGWKHVDDYEGGPLPGGLKEFLARQEKIYPLVRKAAEMQRCEWDSEARTGIDTFPYLNDAKELQQLCKYRVLMLAEEKRWDEAVVLGGDTLVLARHVGVTPLYVAKLVEVGIAWSTTETIAEILSVMPPEQARAVLKRLDSLPISLTGSEVALGETRLSMQHLRAAEKVDPMLVFKPNGVFAGEPGSIVSPAVATLIKGFWGDPDKRAEAISEIGKVGAFASRVMTATREELPKAIEQYDKRRDEAGLVAQLMQPKAIGTIRLHVDAQETRERMLRTAIQIRLEGPGAAAKSKDPFGDGPFEYKETAKGFELRSKLIFRDKPLTLTVGPEK